MLGESAGVDYNATSGECIIVVANACRNASCGILVGEKNLLLFSIYHRLRERIPGETFAGLRVD